MAEHAENSTHLPLVGGGASTPVLLGWLLRAPPSGIALFCARGEASAMGAEQRGLERAKPDNARRAACGERGRFPGAHFASGHSSNAGIDILV